MALGAAYKVACRNQKQAEQIEKPVKPVYRAPVIQLTGIIDKKLVEVPYPEPQGKHAFNRTNDAVDWASWTWNPVTGCNHGCPGRPGCVGALALGRADAGADSV
jgi:hypothetical protein